MSSLAARQPYSGASSPDLGGIRVMRSRPLKRAAISLSVNVIERAWNKAMRTCSSYLFGGACLNIG